jgi:excinuclease ABC subunit C
LPSTTDAPVKELRERVRAGAENRPGVYRMLSGSGVVIYVGKSKRLRTRLMGYFRARADQKAGRIVREARAVEWEYLPSEFASLLRELELIKRLRPPYNVRQKRDAIYTFLKMTAGPAPKLHVVKRVTEKPGTYYGPFRGGRRIVEAVRELNDVLMLRDCRAATPIQFADQQELFAIDRAPLCPRHELRRCLAPCAGMCTEAEYGRNAGQAMNFLTGDASQPLDELERRMVDAAARLEFEHAAALRNRLSRLEALRAEFRGLRQALEGLTFLYAVPGTARQHAVYAIRSGSIRGVYPAPETATQRRQLLLKVVRHFAHPEPASETTAPERIEQILLVAHWFRTRPEEQARTYARDRWNEIPLAEGLNEG